jgi:hypothetical protein
VSWGGSGIRVRSTSRSSPSTHPPAPLAAVTGSGFLSDTTVSFGGVAAPAVAVLDSNGTRLRVVTPPHAVGAVDVVVTNPDGRSATLPGGYTFAALVRAESPPRTPRTVTPRP